MLMEYNQADIRSLAILAHKRYKTELDRTLELPSYISDLIASAKEGSSTFHGANKLYKQGYPRRIRIAPTVKDMLNSLNSINNKIGALSLDTSISAEELARRKKELILSVIKPVDEFDFDPYTEEMGGIWWGDCINGINCRPGLVNNDPSKSIPFTIGKTKVHTIIGGDTGQGKSVAVNAMLVPWLYEYPPWELKIYLNDMKLLEFARYGQGYKCPQIRSIAATGSVTYIISVMKEVEQEMQDLYTIGSIIGSQNLAGIRDYLDMYIPRAMVLTDEFTQAYENATPKEIIQLDFLIQSIAKLGRAMGYHTAKTSQNFTGTMPASTMKQFAIGVSVGADASVSEAIIGNGKALELTKKIGYCLVNNNRAEGSEANNVEYKVAFLDEETDEGKLKMQNMLKRVCDSGRSISEFKQLQYYNETIQDNYDNLEQDYNRYRKEMENYVKSRRLTSFTNVMLGASMRYSGVTNAMEYFIWDYSRRSNVIIHSSDTGDMGYLINILLNSIEESNGDNVKYKVIVDNRELYSEDIFGKMTRDLTGEFNTLGYYGEAVRREYVLKYNLSCDGDSVETSLIDFLEFKNNKVKSQTSKEVLDYLTDNNINCSSEVEEIITRSATAVQTNDTDSLTNSQDIALSTMAGLGEVWAEIDYYNRMMSLRTGNYLKDTDFPKWNIWMLSPQSNEGIFKRGGIMPEFIELLSIGPTVGIFFVLVMDSIRGQRDLLRNAHHIITSKPRQELESYTGLTYETDVKIASRYIKFEGDDEDNFYFKQYLII